MKKILFALALSISFFTLPIHAMEKNVADTQKLLSSALSFEQLDILTMLSPIQNLDTVVANQSASQDTIDLFIECVTSQALALTLEPDLAASIMTSVNQKIIESNNTQELNKLAQAFKLTDLQSNIKSCQALETMITRHDTLNSLPQSTPNPLFDKEKATEWVNSLEVNECDTGSFFQKKEPNLRTLACLSDQQLQKLIKRSPTLQVVATQKKRKNPDTNYAKKSYNDTEINRARSFCIGEHTQDTIKKLCQYIDDILSHENTDNAVHELATALQLNDLEAMCSVNAPLSTPIKPHKTNNVTFKNNITCPIKFLPEKISTNVADILDSPYVDEEKLKNLKSIFPRLNTSTNLADPVSQKTIKKLCDYAHRKKIAKLLPSNQAQNVMYVYENILCEFDNIHELKELARYLDCSELETICVSIINWKNQSQTQNPSNQLPGLDHISNYTLRISEPWGMF